MGQPSCLTCPLCQSTENRHLRTTRLIQDEDNRAYVLSKLAQIDGADFLLLLKEARLIQGSSSRTNVLISLAKIDGADFSLLLKAARLTKSQRGRADVLSKLAQIDGAYFPEALKAARSIQFDRKKHALVLSRLAQIDGADFYQLLDTARSIQSEFHRANVLRDLANHTPQDFLPKILQAVNEINHKPSRIQALSGSLPLHPLTTLSHSTLITLLHPLASRTRADFMGDLATLHPALLHLGGHDALRGIVDAMGDVCQQWK